MRPNEFSIPELAFIDISLKRGPIFASSWFETKHKLALGHIMGNNCPITWLYRNYISLIFLGVNVLIITHRLQHMLRKRYLSYGCTLWTYLDPACLTCISLALMTQGGVVKINHNEGLVVTPTVSIHMIRPCHAMSCHVSCLMLHVMSRLMSHAICLVSCLVSRVVSCRVESCRLVSYHIPYITLYHIISYLASIYHIIAYIISYHIILPYYNVLYLVAPIFMFKWHGITGL